MSITILVVSAVLAALVMAVLGDPHRDRKGRYIPREFGYFKYVAFAVVATVLAMQLTPFLVGLLSNPIAILVIGLAGYFVYKNYVDPR